MMTELWIGGIAATVASCIWVAWGPKVLLATIMTPIVIVGVLISIGMHEDHPHPQLQQQALSPVQQQVQQQREQEGERYRARQHEKYLAQQQALDPKE